ncbi:hypothetical protein NDU88_002314 [Pleurodeles waltl]|uniref:Uncharacterized protein n=1 Tax=Pleurodeles waltl TaxID=8319 RepID=A0AAV7WPU8_PLEWA|nr:hypothetical protein NDU88_002314 [Pleurodeles waltl]
MSQSHHGDRRAAVELCVTDVGDMALGTHLVAELRRCGGDIRPAVSVTVIALSGVTAPVQVAAQSQTVTPVPKLLWNRCTWFLRGCNPGDYELDLAPLCKSLQVNKRAQVLAEEIFDIPETF